MDFEGVRSGHLEAAVRDSMVNTQREVADKGADLGEVGSGEILEQRGGMF